MVRWQEERGLDQATLELDGGRFVLRDVPEGALRDEMSRLRFNPTELAVMQER